MSTTKHKSKTVLEEDIINEIEEIIRVAFIRFECDIAKKFNLHPDDLLLGSLSSPDSQRYSDLIDEVIIHNVNEIKSQLEYNGYTITPCAEDYEYDDIVRKIIDMRTTALSE